MQNKVNLLQPSNITNLTSFIPSPPPQAKIDLVHHDTYTTSPKIQADKTNQTLQLPHTTLNSLSATSVSRPMSIEDIKGGKASPSAMHGALGILPILQQANPKLFESITPNQIIDTFSQINIESLTTPLVSSGSQSMLASAGLFFSTGISNVIPHFSEIMEVLTYLGKLILVTGIPMIFWGLMTRIIEKIEPKIQNPNIQKLFSKLSTGLKMLVSVSLFAGLFAGVGWDIKPLLGDGILLTAAISSIIYVFRDNIKKQIQTLIQNRPNTTEIGDFIYYTRNQGHALGYIIDKSPEHVIVAEVLNPNYLEADTPLNTINDHLKIIDKLESSAAIFVDGTIPEFRLHKIARTEISKHIVLFPLLKGSKEVVEMIRKEIEPFGLNDIQLS
ncbi:hypothetical protein BVY03_01640 [bacterium K02(2017)]|nr:hypothetical protein BVY03_01640 [bacterium K02(2017)]